MALAVPSTVAFIDTRKETALRKANGVWTWEEVASSRHTLNPIVAAS
jgi:hypothetical protein